MPVRRHFLPTVVLALCLVTTACADRSAQVVADDAAAATVDGAGLETSTTSGDGPVEATTTTAAPGPEWEPVEPGGDCQCADGSDYVFWVREADPTRVVFFLQGGGACFDPASCSFTDGNYSVTADAGDDPSLRDGIFRFDASDNPFADWSFVFVTYCTGDVHLGTSTHEYTPDLVVNHVGAVNATAALDEMTARFPDATDIVVAGESAGSAPAPLYAGLTADRYPDARVAVLADGSGAYPDVPAINTYIGGIWGTEGNIPDWPAAQGLTAEQWSLPGLFVQAGTEHPDIVFARHDYAFDETQVFFGELAGFDASNLVELIDGNEAQIEAAGVDVSSFVAPGDDHTVLGKDAVYTETVDGVALIDWIETLVEFTAPGDVHCDDCAGTEA